MLEGIPRPSQESSSAEIKEKIFEDTILTHLIDRFTDGLEEAEYDPQSIEEIKKELEKHSEEEIKGAIAIPEEVREKYLHNLQTLAPEQVVARLIENAKKYGFTVGYHISPVEVRGGHIEGKEKDHRDDDLSRAYYSLHYKDLYLKKKGTFLYLIRAETGENSTHRQDNDGSWGRASSLAIIDRLNLDVVMQGVEEKTRRFLEERNKPRKAA